MQEKKTERWECKKKRGATEIALKKDGALRSTVYDDFHERGKKGEMLLFVPLGEGWSSAIQQIFHFLGKKRKKSWSRPNQSKRDAKGG